MRIRLAAAPLLLTTLLAAAAHAHAFLDHTSPLVGGTVAVAPREVTLWFTQSIGALPPPPCRSAADRQGLAARNQA